MSDSTLRLTRAQVREVDRLAVERYALPSILLMENAARGLADVATLMLHGIDFPTVLVVCGGGNNGGDGLAVARHLHNRAAHVHVIPTIDPERYRGDAAINWEVVRRMGIASSRGPIVGLSPHLIIDALFGTGLSGAVRDSEVQWIDLINAQQAPVLAADIPSGLDCDTGEPLGACVRATRTVTFVAEKVGFANPASRQYTGEVTVADIGAPRELIAEVAGR